VIDGQQLRPGDVWWADLHDPWGQRPVVLLARGDAYRVLSWVMIAPTTSRLRRISTALILDPVSDPIPKPCTLLLDHIQSIRQESLLELIGQLSETRIAEVDLALHRALGIEVCPTR
jgi:mRNA interferase MazF